jgi:hypothetical protein
MARDDRLLAPTRWTAAAVIPVLVAAFVILYLFPGNTTRLWGWTIRPEMSAQVMGAGYLSGAYFFGRAARTSDWHRVGPGFLATTVFAGLLLVTTVLHWDRFNHDHVSFWAWLALYGTTPFLLPWLWARNRRTDPGTPSPDDVRVPGPLRVAVGVGGAAQLAVAAVMFGWPHLAARAWPWALDAATSRSLSAFVAFPAIAWLWFLVDDRWSSFRITEQTATIGLALIALGALRRRGELRAAGWNAELFAVALALALALNVALMVALDRRSRPGADEAAGDRAPGRGDGYDGQRR